ncbi:hypothetical protein EDEG_01421 [Edhazardia aedis USNM 41457]|uniref:Uncharacterized protein n=1 Tax=Edhazardia aedis (strain USNM 41457) TaxID=1003232 RepID=J9DSJ4_EDHAE|nr:hypothetical protein EDEG_01421 [Edhazardia aedis USNM 41457]|eukprot:EJW04297.1 hypothetical protein EDEG_01421 [Edhazardia aedis USNM 41457]
MKRFIVFILLLRIKTAGSSELYAMDNLVKNIGEMKLCSDLKKDIIILLKDFQNLVEIHFRREFYMMKIMENLNFHLYDVRQKRLWPFGKEGEEKKAIQEILKEMYCCLEREILTINTSENFVSRYNLTVKSTIAKISNFCDIKSVQTLKESDKNRYEHLTFHMKCFLTNLHDLIKIWNFSIDDFNFTKAEEKVIFEEWKNNLIRKKCYGSNSNYRNFNNTEDQEYEPAIFSQKQPNIKQKKKEKSIPRPKKRYNLLGVLSEDRPLNDGDDLLKNSDTNSTEIRGEICEITKDQENARIDIEDVTSKNDNQESVRNDKKRLEMISDERVCLYDSFQSNLQSASTPQRSFSDIDIIGFHEESIKSEKSKKTREKDNKKKPDSTLEFPNFESEAEINKENFKIFQHIYKNISRYVQIFNDKIKKKNFCEAMIVKSINKMLETVLQQETKFKTEFVDIDQTIINILHNYYNLSYIVKSLHESLKDSKSINYRAEEFFNKQENIDNLYVFFCIFNEILGVGLFTNTAINANYDIGNLENNNIKYALDINDIFRESFDIFLMLNNFPSVLNHLNIIYIYEYPRRLSCLKKSVKNWLDAHRQQPFLDDDVSPIE